MSKRESTEYFGQGQSGYTAGRVEGDPSMGLEGRNVALPPTQDRDKYHADNDHIDDDRFTGRGGVRWAPEDVEELEEGLAAEEDKPLVEKKVADISRSFEDASK
jgi:hypothetical protein